MITREFQAILRGKTNKPSLFIKEILLHLLSSCILHLVKNRRYDSVVWSPEIIFGDLYPFLFLWTFLFFTIAWASITSGQKRYATKFHLSSTLYALTKSLFKDDSKLYVMIRDKLALLSEGMQSPVTKGFNSYYSLRNEYSMPY